MTCQVDTWTKGKIIPGNVLSKVDVTCFSACIDECKNVSGCEGVNVQNVGGGTLECKLMSKGNGFETAAEGFYIEMI